VYVCFDLEVDGADRETVAWFATLFTERMFSPLFPPPQVMSNPNAPRPTSAPRPAANPTVFVPAGPHAHERTITDRMNVLLRENDVDLVPTTDGADIQIAVRPRVTFESDAFPFGHPERTDTPTRWTILRLAYSMTFGASVRGTGSSPDRWELVGEE
jgi:hypothetical protein